MNRLLRYYRTLRYLKFIQIQNRLIRKILKPRVSGKNPPSIGSWNGKWIFCSSPEVFDGESFTFLNHTEAIRSACDWNFCTADKLWLYNLHYFDFLKQEAYRNNPRSIDWMECWIRENPSCRGNGWEPYPLSLRIVNWIKWVWSGNQISEEVHTSLVEQVRCLEQSLEYHLLANHLMANGKALIFAGCFFSGAEAKRWLAKGWKIYHSELKEQILPDGAHFERSPMYHSIILEDFLDVYQVTHSEDLRPYIEKMLFFLAGMTFPDRRIALFNDSAFGIAPDPDQIIRYAEQLGFAHPVLSGGIVDFPDSGYVRVHHGIWDLILDAGALGPDYQPGHAHADTLSFELSCCGRRIISNMGTSCYNGSERAYQRGTSAHNAIVVDGKNSSEVWSSHRVGQRAKIIDRAVLPSAVCASHNGYKPVIHKRTWHWSENSIYIDDLLNGAGKHKIELYLHFMPGEEFIRNGDNEFYTVSGLVVTLPKTGKNELLETEIGLEFGRKIPNKTLKVTLEERLPLQFQTRITSSV